MDYDISVDSEFYVDHASCMYIDGCEAETSRIIDPWQYEIYGVEVEIDICDEHLRLLCDDI